MTVLLRGVFTALLLGEKDNTRTRFSPFLRSHFISPPHKLPASPLAVGSGESEWPSQRLASRVQTKEDEDMTHQPFLTAFPMSAFLLRLSFVERNRPC
ncbi:hypothetical protein QQF64_007736 [Cirrhinus molitorella]|uniref:Secreted protein n=1 Tax=Cirrhinus molitorella TaxID=172907 RepID=A0ABR3MDT6_9TELE